MLSLGTVAFANHGKYKYNFPDSTFYRGRKAVVCSMQGQVYFEKSSALQPRREAKQCTDCCNVTVARNTGIIIIFSSAHQRMHAQIGTQF